MQWVYHVEAEAQEDFETLGFEEQEAIYDHLELLLMAADTRMFYRSEPEIVVAALGDTMVAVRLYIEADRQRRVLHVVQIEQGG